VPVPTLLIAPGDIHAPLQDDKALHLMTYAAVDTATRLGIPLREVELVSTGDTFNSAGFSPHPGVRKSVHALGGTVEEEARAMKPWIEAWPLRGVIGGTFMAVYLMGAPCTQKELKSNMAGLFSRTDTICGDLSPSTAQAVFWLSIQGKTHSMDTRIVYRRVPRPPLRMVTLLRRVLGR
jgi:hypothetical protein